MSQLSEFASSLCEDVLSAQQTFVSQAYNAAVSGNATIYFPIKAPLGYNLGGAVIRADVTITTSGAGTLTAGYDFLSEWCNQYEVVGGTGGPTRLRALTRLGAEATERLFVQPANAGSAYNATTNPFTYPRGTPAAVNTTTRTDTSYMVAPASGGQACQIRFVYPAGTSVFTTVTAYSITFTCYAIPTLSNAVTASVEILTQTIPVGTTDLATQYQPDDISPLLLQFVGTTGGANAIGRLYHETASSRSVIADFEDSGTLVAVQQMFPQTPGNADTTSVVLNMQRQRARALKVTMQGTWNSFLDLLYIDIEDAPTAAPTTTPSATPVPAATGTTATTGAGGTVIPTKSGGIGGGNSGPGHSGTTKTTGRGGFN
ncbi:MAG: hypothetical protein ACLP74_01475 [Thermoplasmata archaeon]